MRKIGYERVSSIGQNLARQNEVLKTYCDVIFSEKESGKDVKNRPVLKSLLDNILIDGDILVVASLDRLSRSVYDLLNIVKLLQSKNIGLISLKENINIKDKMDAYSTFFVTMLGALAEMERSLIKERQLEGIRINRAKGKPYGRKKINEATIKSAVDFYLNQKSDVKLNVSQVASFFKISRATLYRALKNKKFSESEV